MAGPGKRKVAMIRKAGPDHERLQPRVQTSRRCAQAHLLKDALVEIANGHRNREPVNPPDGTCSQADEKRTCVKRRFEAKSGNESGSGLAIRWTRRRHTGLYLA